MAFLPSSAAFANGRAPGAGVTAVLGPTNTGKTHLAIERPLPGASIVPRPRLSTLEFAADRKITRQPRRTAIARFAADEVYAIAELIRRERGGAAVVLDSLSTRTRNAQVEMFQNGDVD